MEVISEELVKLGDCCRVWLAENGRGSNLGFILARGEETHPRGAKIKYLVAHRFGIDWCYQSIVLPAMEYPLDELSLLCQPNNVLVSYADLPESWVKPLYGGNPRAGWDYVGPKYWEGKK